MILYGESHKIRVSSGASAEPIPLIMDLKKFQMRALHCYWIIAGK
jgi:hypothetical protein